NLPWANEEHTERRRALAVAVTVARAETWYIVLQLSLLTTHDTEWLLDFLPDAPIDAITPLTNCAWSLAQTPTTRVAERILNLPSMHPAYEATAHMRGSIDIESESVRLSRELAAEEHELRQRQIDHQLRVASALTELFDRLHVDVDDWWRVPCL